MAIDKGFELIRKGYVKEFMDLLNEFREDEVEKQYWSKILVLKGDSKSLLGEWDDALEIYRKSLKLYSETEYKLGMAKSYRGIARISFPRGTTSWL